jgi:hypothetical protein
MDHLVLTIHTGWVAYRMGVSSGSHPIGDDSPAEVIDYLIRILRPSTHEVLGPKK